MRVVFQSSDVVSVFCSISDTLTKSDTESKYIVAIRVTFEVAFVFSGFRLTDRLADIARANGHSDDKPAPPWNIRTYHQLGSNAVPISYSNNVSIE